MPIQTQFELAQLFPNLDIEAIIPSDLKHPGVAKLEKITRHLRKIVELQYDVILNGNGIKISMKDAEIRIEPWGILHIIKIKSGLLRINHQTKFEILILNEHCGIEPGIEPVYIEFKSNIHNIHFDIAFHGKIELELVKNNLTIKIEPRSKVQVFHL